ncbi:TRAP transporter small permease subunit [Ichthyobacterium seriolicida]|uniref:TRAP dicarboxylate transporter subunit DctQ n=1 Tax=Ichthyobacterium seriolicida TaxID=242600 RepID=A0A1J1E4P2_9FLAO|nr:TRAP transporter small permease subunit [Ichthyobacterium seriolicida]BAV95020.1 TRAP dicarboxylate transporter subunit DctQ [Ichthyobacterium seriolicida]
MLRIIKLLDDINNKVGEIISWFVVVLMIVICIDVIMRYLFDFTFIWVTEIETYLFGSSFILASGYTYLHDKHVRVDVFYSKWSDKTKAIINLIGNIFFLLPWSLIIIICSWEFAYMSFSIGERSPQPGGLPALYILKFSITVGFTLLFIQGISSVLKSIVTIRKIDK